MGRNTQGVHVINVEETDRVVAAVKLVQPEDVTEDQVEESSDSGEPPVEPPADDTIH